MAEVYKLYNKRKIKDRGSKADKKVLKSLEPHRSSLRQPNSRGYSNQKNNHNQLAAVNNQIAFDSIQSTMSSNMVPRENLKKNLLLFIEQKSQKTRDNKKFFNSRDKERALFTDEELPTKQTSITTQTKDFTRAGFSAYETNINDRSATAALEASGFTSYGHCHTSVSPHENQKLTMTTANTSVDNNGRKRSYAGLGQKALLRKLMMKNAKTRTDHIVAKYNYQAPKDSQRRNKTMHYGDKGQKSGKAVFFDQRKNSKKSSTTIQKELKEEDFDKSP